MLLHNLSIMSTQITILIFVLLTVFANGQIRNEPIGNNGYFTDLGRSSIQFSIKIYQNLVRTKDENVLLSPFSLQLILGLLQVAANGTTASELANVLELPLTKEELEKHLGKLYNLATQGQNDKSSRKIPEINIVNAIYVRDNVKVPETFYLKAKERLHADIRSLAVRHNNDTIVTNINSWISQQTHGQISDILKEGDVTTDTVMLLINALHFKGRWAEYGFDINSTKRERFFNGKNYSQVNMMRTTGYFNIGRYDNLEVTYLELPYADTTNSDDKDYILAIYLPDDAVDGLKTVNNNLPELLSSPPSVQDEQVDVRLPRFRVEAGYYLREVLEELGIRTAFSNAQLDALTVDKKSVSVSNVVHNTVLDVNEEGTEASAATIVGVVDRIFSQPIPFYADKPFMFVLGQKTTGIILFIGQYKG